MINQNIQSNTGVTLVGAGPIVGQDIDEAQKLAPMIVAADGGANHCLRIGLSPMAVIGDFDSISAEAMAALDDARLFRIDEQDTTDFEKCLLRIDAPFVLAAGFTGGRMDHFLAVCSVLARQVGPPCIVLSEKDVVFAAPEGLHLPLASDTRISLFPMTRVMGKSTGLQWPIDGLELVPNGQIGTSNNATGAVHLEFDQPGCLVILPRSALPLAINAVSA